MLDYLMQRRFPCCLGPIEDYVTTTNTDAVTNLSDNELDQLESEFGDWLYETSGFLDAVTVDNISDPMPPDVAALSEQGRFRWHLRNLLVQMIDYYDDLIVLKFDELKKQYDTQQVADAAALGRKEAVEDKGRFFNNATSSADFDYWRDMPFWTPSEAAALLLGKDPRAVNEKSLKPLRKTESPFVQQFFRLKEVVARAIQAQRLSGSAGPLEVASWATRARISHSEKFADWVKSVSVGGDDAPEDRLSTSERHSLYKILLGLAAAHYGYLPSNFSDERNGAYSAITANANLAGFRSLDEKTVRQYLKAAATWAFHSETRLAQPSPEKLKGNSSRKTTIPGK